MIETSEKKGFIDSIEETAKITTQFIIFGAGVAVVLWIFDILVI